MHTSPLLTVQDLHAGYGETEVLRGVNLTVDAGEVVAVLGSNGVGKSTLNRAISGIVRARSGAIVFDGADLVREKPAAIVARGLIHVPAQRGGRRAISAHYCQWCVPARVLMRPRVRCR